MSDTPQSGEYVPSSEVRSDLVAMGQWVADCLDEGDQLVFRTVVRRLADEVEHLRRFVFQRCLKCGLIAAPVEDGSPTFVSGNVLADLLALHAPTDEEVECWADDEEGPEVHAERFPECPGNTDPGRCEGHSYDFRTCSECGQVGSHDEIRFRPWPCATLVAVGYDTSSNAREVTP